MVFRRYLQDLCAELIGVPTKQGSPPPLADPFMKDTRGLLFQAAVYHVGFLDFGI